MRSRAFAAAIGLAGCALLIARRVGDAHAMLLSSEPAANASLAKAPSRIRLVFSEAVDASVSGIKLIAGSAPAVDLKVTGDPRERAALVAPVSALAVGAYRVVWRTVSADGHRIDGGYSFTIIGDTTVAVTPAAPSPAQPPQVESGTPTVAAIARGSAMALLMALTGLLFFSLRADSPDRRVVAACSWISVATVIAISGHFVAWSATAAPDHGVSVGWIGKMMQTHQGMVEMARWAASILSMICVAIARKTRPGFMYAAIALGFSAAIGHPAATLPLFAIPTMAVHLFAGAIWFGGLLWILCADRSNRDAYVRGVQGISRLALWSVIAMFASGAVQSLLLVRPITSLLSTAYGWLLVAKIGAAVLLVLLGAYHRYRAVPRVETGVADFGASLRLEIALMTVVMMMAGLLSYLSPHLA